MEAASHELLKSQPPFHYRETFCPLITTAYADFNSFCTFCEGVRRLAWQFSIEFDIVFQSLSNSN